MLAVDPSSPFTGGAILGDRVRMQDHATDPGCSSARWPPAGTSAGWRWRRRRRPPARRFGTAGSSSRPSASARSRWRSRARPTRPSSSSTPGWGDAVQANKAGLMDVADVFVINKADRPGADGTRSTCEQMLDLRRGRGARTRAGRADHRQRGPAATASPRVGRGLAAPATPGHWRVETATRLRPREELCEIVARRLELRARELASGERWDDSMTTASCAPPTRGPPPTRCSTASAPDAAGVGFLTLPTPAQRERDSGEPGGGGRPGATVGDRSVKMGRWRLNELLCVELRHGAELDAVPPGRWDGCRAICVAAACPSVRRSSTVGVPSTVDGLLVARRPAARGTPPRWPERAPRPDHDRGLHEGPTRAVVHLPGVGLRGDPRPPGSEVEAEIVVVDNASASDETRRSHRRRCGAVCVREAVARARRGPQSCRRRGVEGRGGVHRR